MKCLEALDRMSAYADGELSRQDRFDMQAHINECAGCKRELEALEALQSRVHSSLLEVEATDMTDSVMSKLPRKPLVRRGRWAWVWTAAVCLMAALAVGLYLKSAQPVAVKQIVVRRPHDVEPAIVPPAQTPKTPPMGISKPHVAKAPMHKAKPPVSIASKPKRIPTQPVVGETTGFAVETNVAEIPLPSNNGERRSRVITTLKIGDLTVSRTIERVVIPAPRDEDAQFIERPPLKVVES